MMSGIGIGDVFLPTDRSNPRGRFVETLLCLLQSYLMTVYVEFDANGSSECFAHGNGIADHITKVKKGGGQGAEHCGALRCVAFPP